jgi:Protein of unknown function (DUF4012)
MRPPRPGALRSERAVGAVPQRFEPVGQKYARPTVSTRVPPSWAPRAVSSRQLSLATVALLAVGAGIGGAFAGCQPTGTRVADVIETAALAASFTFLASLSSRHTWLVVGVATVALARGWLLVPAVATIGIAFAAAFMSRSHRRVGALVGALGVQVVLRWPPNGFHGLPTLVAGTLMAVMMISVWHRSGSRARRRALFVVAGLAAGVVVVSLPLVITTLLVRGEASRGQAAAQSALSNIGNGSSAAVVGDLQHAAIDTTSAASALGGWVTAGARLVPIVAQQARFLTGVVSSASQTLTVAAREAPAIDYHRLGYHNGRIDLTRLNAMQSPMQILDGQLRTTDDQLASLNSSWLVGPLERRAVSLRQKIGRAHHAAALAIEAAKVLPAMLGGDGVRHYFIAFMSPSEDRGYDGFVGSYGLLTADHGHVSLTLSGVTSDLEASLPPGGATLRGVSSFLARYGQFNPGEYLRDATFSPDLLTVAKVLSQEYEQTGGVQVDGVLAIDPYGLAALLHFTGPIEVPGLPVPLTWRNAAYVLLKEQYTTFDAGETNQDLLRHDFLQQALHLAFDKLVAGSLPAPRTLAAVLDPVVVQGRISFWSFHRGEQPLLRQVGIDGAFPSTQGGDLLAVTTQNSGANKIDAFLHTSVFDHVTFNPSDGDISSEVAIAFKNDAPASGLPPIVIDSVEPGLAPGTNRMWLTLYSPLAFENASINGQLETMSSGVELGVNAYSSYVDVPPGGTVTLRVHLTGQVRSRAALSMSVRLQPGANAGRNSVEVTPTGAWKFATTADSARWSLSAAMVQHRVFRFDQG